jgi:hypothetical protein
MGTNFKWTKRELKEMDTRLAQIQKGTKITKFKTVEDFIKSI